MPVVGTRERWLAALLIVVLAAPIVGVTLYFLHSVQLRIAYAESERRGLTRIAEMKTFLAGAIAYENAVACPVPATNLAVLRARTDDDLQRIEAPSDTAATLKHSNLAAIHSTWEKVRTTTDPHVDFSPLFDALSGAFMQVADDSGLSFDPDIEGLDFADSLTYRLPQAAGHFANTFRMLCVMHGSQSVDQRVALAVSDARGEERAEDGLEDVADALQRGGDAGALLDVSRANARADEALAALELAAVPKLATLATLQQTLLNLMATEIPPIDRRIQSHIDAYRMERLLAVVPGLLGLFASLAVAALSLRVLYARAKQRVAEQSAAEHERRAMHDSLTGLLNRRAFAASLASARSDDGIVGILCIIDVDEFKGINDTYGHPGGDEVLRRLARIIEGAVRSTDVAARLGGDEFAVFLRAPIDEHGVERFLRIIAADACAPHQYRDRTIVTSISAGAALILDNSEAGIEDATARADAALYEAKRNARGSHVFDW